VTIAHVSLRSIDIGFDPRLHDIAVELPVERMLEVDYGNGDESIVGPPHEVGAALTRAGYRVVWTWADMPTDCGATVRTDDDGAPILEMVDPNDRSQARHQYRILHDHLRRRVMPASGDRWRDQTASPEWEPMDTRHLMAPHILLAWRDTHAGANTGARVPP
jgi:hypothetical protein